MANTRTPSKPFPSSLDPKDAPQPVAFVACALFLLLFGLYQWDRIPAFEDTEGLRWASYFPGTILPSTVLDCYSTDDSTPNLLVGIHLRQEGRLTFPPERAAPLLRWSMGFQKDSSPRQSVRLQAMDEPMAELIHSGKLRIEEGYYAVVPSANGRFASTFGAGAGITSIPAMAAVSTTGIDLLEEPAWLRRVGHWTAAACVAGSALFLFLVAVDFMPLPWAVVLAVIYAFGTCAYSESSLYLSQHGPTELYLAGGIFFLHRSARTTWVALLAGGLLAAATWCRPTSVILFACVAAYLFFTDRRRLFLYLSAGVPIGIGLMVANTIQFGGPTQFGQTELHHHALEKTGSPEIWQTSLLYGAVASLLSPSRGLFVLSPFLVFCLAGWWGIGRDPRLSFLKPIPWAVLLTWGVEFRHFDWWGGWSYGYRHLVDTVILLMFTLIPVFLGWHEQRQRLFSSLSRRVFAALAVVSIAIHLTGAFLYDRWGWNARMGYLVSFEGEAEPRMTIDAKQAEAWAKEGGTVSTDAFNIDNPSYRHRLWSITDSQLVYSLTHPILSYRSKQAQQAIADLPRSVRLAETWDRLGQTACTLGETASARDYFRRSLSIEPRRIDAYFHLQSLGGGEALSGEPTPTIAEPENLDWRLRYVLRLLAEENLDEAVNLVEGTAAVLSLDHRDGLVWALNQLAAGEKSGKASDALRPMRERLFQLIARLQRKGIPPS